MSHNTAHTAKLIEHHGVAMAGVALAAATLLSGCATPPLGFSHEPLSLGEITGSTGIARARTADRRGPLPNLAWQNPGEIDQEDDALLMDAGDTPEGSGTDGAAGSNPLAAVSKADLYFQYTRTNSGDDLMDYNVRAATMLTPKVKLLIEAHYWDTNVTGDDEADLERLSVKPIWFPHDRRLNETWGMRVAVGFEYIKDFDNTDKGIGVGTDQIAPLFGLAFMNSKSKTVLIPLMQHFEDIGSGPEVSTTAFRLIALQPLSGGYWLKGDLKVPRDWENETWPASAEVEGGKMITSKVGLFLTGLTGVGGDKPFDWGAALSVRVNF